MSEPLSIERYAEAAVYCREYPVAVRSAVLRGLGTTPVDVDAAASYWGRQLADGLAKGDPTHALRFAHIYGRVEHRVRLYRPDPVDVRPEQFPSVSEQKPRLARRAMKPLASAAAPRAHEPEPTGKEPAVDVPTYLRQQRDGLGGGSALPASAPVAPGPAESVADDGSETALLPVPSALAAMLAPKPKPLPFSGEADPARIAELARPLGPDEVEDQSGETAELPVPAELARRFAAAQPFAKKKADLPAAAAPALNLERYAAFRAALVVHGQEDAGTLQRFGVPDAAQKEALQAEYFRRFSEEPELRDRFQVLLEAEIARLRVGGR